MHTLVTGGAGMIGSHLVDALLARAGTVSVVDNLLTGQRRNLAHLEAEPRLRVVEADVVELAPSAELGGPFDRVYHLASTASPPDFARYPLETLMTNAIGTRNVLELARRDNARFLLASTSEAYGDPTEHPQREDYWGNVNPVGPRSCYNEGKRFAESLTVNFGRAHGVDVRIARIFNTYGPRTRLDDGRVVPNFCMQALAGEPLTIYGSGGQTRSLCYIDDTVRGMVALMETGGLSGEVVNIGSPEEQSVRKIAETILRLAGSASQLVHRSLPADDPTRRCPDIAKARRLLGWSPRVSLRDGLSCTLDYFRSELAAGRTAPDPVGSLKRKSERADVGEGQSIAARG